MAPSIATLLAKLLAIGLTTVSVNAEQHFCPIIASFEDDKSIQSSSFDEISGLCMSPSQIAPSGQPVLFGVNDRGGGGQRIGVFDSGTGERLMSLRIRSSVATNKDWESLTIGSCGATGENKTCLYIADTGDNRARTSSGDTSQRNSRYRLIKIEEPLLEYYQDGDTLPDSTISVLHFTYRSLSSPTNRADCEAVFLDHAGWGEGGAIGDLYLVTKWGKSDAKRKTRLFKFPTTVWLNTTDRYEPEAVGSYDGGGSLMGYTWTGADSSFDGTLVSLVGYTDDHEDTTNFLFLRCPGSTMAEALAAPNGTTQHCLEWKSPVQQKLESFAWNPEGTKTFNIPEGSRPNIGITTFVYDPAKAGQTCPRVAWIQGVSGTYCETVTDAIRKPEAWCEAAFPNSTAELQDDPLGTLQGTPGLVPEKEEERPHDTLQPPKTWEEAPEDPQVELSEVTTSTPATSAAEHSAASQSALVFILAAALFNFV
jgi:hypothetical protein